MLVHVALVLFALLPMAAQALAIETLHLPDTHSQQSHRALGLTSISESGPVAVTSVTPASALVVQDIEIALSSRPQPVEPPEYPLR